ncbi:MAG: TonB-dependent receptor [Tannerellaceae bacterium]|nr:TonB-dependent receptor [Tannerellaceae bacterium]
MRGFYIPFLIFLSVFLLNTDRITAGNQVNKITLDLKSGTLKEFIREIEQQTQLIFIYGEDIDPATPLTCVTNNNLLTDVLHETLSPLSISHLIRDKHIILNRQPVKSGEEKTYTISGYILDAVSHETLIGAHLFASNINEGTVTNEFGFYSITLPAGSIQLNCTYIGFQPGVREIELNKNISLTIYLNPSNELDAVVVYGTKPETGIKATQMGAMDISLTAINNTPTLLGEADIMKTIQMMPGVQAGTEGSAGIHVRGGGPDENLILMDGVPLYNVEHLFGFFSVFTPEAIKKVSLFKGSFPARFGGRLSSVIDIRTNDGDMQRFHGTVGIGLLSSKIQLEGPIVKERTSFHVSARRSYWDLVARPFMHEDDKFGYYFYDVNAKINHRFNDRSRIFLSVYNGKDKLYSRYEDDYQGYLSKDEINTRWGNFMTALKWNYQLSPKLFSNTTVAYTEYMFTAESDYRERSLKHHINTEYWSQYSSGIQDWSYQFDLDYHPSPQHHIKTGIGYLYHCFKPEVETSRIKTEEDNTTTEQVHNSLSSNKTFGHEVSLYAEDNFDIGTRFSVNAGLHISLFNVPSKTYASLQPRISGRYQLTNHTALKAAYTKMSQYSHLLSNYLITMPTDLWVPTTAQIKPMQAHQYSIGAYYTRLKGWEFSAESYYKSMHNVLEYKDGASFLGSSHNREDKVEMGNGRAMGIEFMAEKTTGKTTGWIAYTLAKSDRKFSEDGINNGKRFPYKYDRRYHINVSLNHKFSDKMDIGASWEFYTGGTTTIAEQVTLIPYPDKSGEPWWTGTQQEADYIENRNNYRMPESHRLNIGINFHKKKKYGIRTWNISVYNIYNAMNPTFLYRTTEYEGSGENYQTRTVLKKVSILPFIPSVSYIYKF